jgi:hypothetical protein
MDTQQQLIRQVRHGSLIGALTAAVAAAIMMSTVMAQDSFPLPDFSATEIAYVKRRQIASKIYHSGLNFRSEPAPGVATLYMPARDTVYSLMFNGTQCIETKGMRMQPVSSPLQLLSGVKLTRAAGGTEIVEGHTCKVENIAVTKADGTTYQLKLWGATDLKGIPVRVDLLSNGSVVTTTYQDIKLQTPDPALFQPPKNCKPFEKTYQIAPPEKPQS